MKRMISVVIGGLLISAFMIPAQAETVIQVWSCEIKDGKTREDLMAVSVKWMEAVNNMDGGENFESYLEYPLAAENVESFSFVMIADSATNWGRFEDAYGGSEAAAADEEWGAVADCSSSSLWNQQKVE